MEKKNKDVLNVSEGKAQALVTHWRALQERFHYLNGLRTTTSRIYITILGAVGVLIIGLYTMDSTNNLITSSIDQVINGIIFLSFLLYILGICVLVYDAQIRQRTSVVGEEIERIVKILGLLEFEKNPRNLSEDFWFSSQIFIVSNIPLLVMVFALLHKPNEQILTCHNLIVGIFLLLVFTILTTLLWVTYGNYYKKKIKNWTPT